MSRIQGVVVDGEHFTLRSCNWRFEVIVVDLCVSVVRERNDQIVEVICDTQGQFTLPDKLMPAIRNSGFRFHPNRLTGGLCRVVTALHVLFFCGSPVLCRLFPCDTTCRTQEFPRPFHDPEIGHQRCQTIRSVSSGTRALTWYGTIRAV